MKWKLTRIFCFLFYSILGYILSTPINKRIDIFFSLIGAALFIASGAIILNEWNDGKSNYISFEKLRENKDLVPVKGGLAITNGILFILDVVFTFRDWTNKSK